MKSVQSLMWLFLLPMLAYAEPQPERLTWESELVVEVLGSGNEVTRTILHRFDGTYPSFWPHEFLLPEYTYLHDGVIITKPSSTYPDLTIGVANGVALFSPEELREYFIMLLFDGGFTLSKEDSTLGEMLVADLEGCHIRCLILRNTSYPFLSNFAIDVTKSVEGGSSSQ